ncbi:MAG: Wadjet anti-phage system protein JetD domain-containing protein [Lacisediminihabitans sp.]
MKLSMVTVADARQRARKLVERDQRQWAATDGDAVRFEIVLHPPIERTVQADVAGAVAWTHSWRELASTAPAAEITWADRHWPSVGRQSVPERCVLLGADAIASFAGPTAAREWRTLRERADRLRIAFAESEASVGPLATAIRIHGSTLQRLADADFVTLIDVVAWLVDNPASGWRIRQLPIRGIDTKWLERHRSVVEGLHAAVAGRESLGLLAPPPQVRVRFLDPALRPGGICDITAPVEELAVLDLAPGTVFVFENLETVLAMPDMPGAVVVHGSGYAARRLSAIPWIQSGAIIYWGDLDSDGFAILHALRSGCSNVTSVLMDEETLLAYQDLWVPEIKPAVGVYSTLTTGELRALERIRAAGNIRLEQERIGWEYALGRLLGAAEALRVVTKPQP